MRRVFLGTVVLVSALASCHHQSASASEPTNPAASSVEVQPLQPRTRPGAKLEECSTSFPIRLYTLNATTSRGDLCAAFNRIAPRLLRTSYASANNPMVAIELIGLTYAAEVRCQMRVVLTQGRKSLNFDARGVVPTSSGSNARRDDTRDCVDAVIEDLMGTSVVAAMQQLAPTPQSTSAMPASSSFPYHGL